MYHLRIIKSCMWCNNYNVPSQLFNLRKPTGVKLYENLQLYHNCLHNTEVFTLSSYQLLTVGDVCDFVSPSAVRALSPSSDKIVWELLSSVNGDWAPPSTVWLLHPEPSSVVEDCLWISWNNSNSCPTWSSRSSFSCRSVSLSPSASWVVYLPSCCASVVA